MASPKRNIILADLTNQVAADPPSTGPDSTNVQRMSYLDKTVQVTITGTATVDIEASMDNTNWQVIATFINESGNITNQQSWNYLRANLTAYTSGDVKATVAQSEITGGLQPTINVTTSNITASTTPPSTPSDGDLWFNTSTNELNVYHSGVWNTLFQIDIDELDDLADVTITGAVKGDILVFNGTAWVDLTVGSNDQVLTADSAEATGVKWAPGATNPYLDVNSAGTAASAAGTDGIALGEDSTAQGNYSVAIGQNSDTKQPTAIAIGQYAVAGSASYSYGQGAVAVGRSSTAGQTNDVAIGNDANTGSGGYYDSRIAIGNNPDATAGFAIAIGRDTVASSQDSVALGHYAQAPSNGLEIRVNQSASASTVRLESGGQLKVTGANAQVAMPGYAAASLPTGEDGGMVFVTDEDQIAFYDSAAWRRLANKDLTVTTVTGTTYTILSTDDVIVADDDTAGGTITLTLPAAASSTGQRVSIKKTGSTGDVKVDGNGSEDVDGSDSATLTIQYESITVVCDGTEWWII